MPDPRYSAHEVATALATPTVTFLGAGAFGDTWRSGDTAVKIICEDGYPAERVTREVRGLQRVASSHVVKLTSVSTVELGGQSRPALTFEFVAGGDLEAKIGAGSRPTAAEATSLLVGLLLGLKDMHAADGTVHRDVKPSNVALRDGDWARPVLLDLGLARSNTEQTMTMYPGRLGTARYMAPEQLRGERARKAADLFAVGVTVRAAMTGQHPFYNDSESYTWDEALSAIASGPSSVHGLVDPKTAAVLDRIVSFDEYARGSATSNLKRLGFVA